MLVFKQWITKFNQTMKLRNKKVLLLLDNASTHQLDKDCELSHVTFFFLPPNTTSLLQPLDQGIIHSFKCFYKNQLINKLLDRLEVTETYALPDLKEALYMVQNSWKKVTVKSIKNCWHHCKYVSFSDSDIEDGSINLKLLSDNINKLNFKKDSFNVDEILILINVFQLEKHCLLTI